MTCHEFRQTVLSLTPLELSRLQDEQLWGHAGDCRPCGGWLQRQHTLASGLQSLRNRTTSLEAGPNVERALLEVFRQGPRKGMQPGAVLASTPVAFRLSRFFEMGAYVAAAAAIAVGLFLGVRLWYDGARVDRAQSQSASSAVTGGVQPKLSPAQVAAPTEPTKASETASLPKRIAPVRRRASASERVARLGTATQSQVISDADYVALMFCDPLSCAGDTQVVRMEIPGTPVAGFSEEQTRIADVVVGYDGLVRAVRMVN